MMNQTHTMLLRCKTLGGARKLQDAAKHNLREISGPHIAEDRLQLNEVLAGPQTASEVGRAARERAVAAAIAGGRATARLIERKNGTRAAEIIFGLPVVTSVDPHAYFRACLSWVESTFGDVVLSAVVHHDEAAPHEHVLMLPMRGGKWCGSSVFGKKVDIQAMLNDFHRVVGRRFGLRRAPSRLSAADRANASARVIAHLKTTADPVLRSKTWPLVHGAIAADPACFAEHLGVKVHQTLRTLAQLKVSAGHGGHREKASSIEDRVGRAPIAYALLEDLKFSAAGSTHQNGVAALSLDRQAAARSARHGRAAIGLRLEQAGRTCVGTQPVRSSEEPDDAHGMMDAANQELEHSSNIKQA